MASLLELGISTGKWDSGLKKAQTSLNAFIQSQGGLQQALDKENDKIGKFVQMMGKMESTANTAKGQLRDYKNSIEQLSHAYNQLNDEQKKSTTGRSFLQAIDQLKSKATAARAEVDNLNKSLENVSNSSKGLGAGLFGGGKLDGMLQVFGGNMMTKAAGWAVKLAGEIGDCVKEGIELARQGEGIRIAFERLNRPDLLDKLKEATHGTVTELELMKQAVKFNDFNLSLDEMGTMLAFAQQKAKDTGQSVDYMVDSIVTGLGRKSLMILDNLGLSAAEIKEKMKSTGDMTKAVGAIIREQMSSAGDYVETAADRATRANVELQNAMERLGRTFQPLSDAGSNLWNNLKIGALDLLNNAIEPLINRFTELGRMRKAYESIGGDTKVGDQIDRLKGSNYKKFLFQSTVNEYNRQINDLTHAESVWNRWRSAGHGGVTDAEIASVRTKYGTDNAAIRRNYEALRQQRDAYISQANSEVFNPVVPGVTPVVATTTTTKTGKVGHVGSNTVQKTEEQLNSEQINALTNEYINATDERRKAIEGEIKTLQERNDEIKKLRDAAQGKVEVIPEGSLKQLKNELSELQKERELLTDPISIDIQDKAIDEVKRKIDELEGKPVKVRVETTSGMTDAASMMQSMKFDMAMDMDAVDRSTMKNLMEVVVQNGIDNIDIDWSHFQEMMAEGMGVPDDKWQEVVTKINEKLESMGLDPIKLDVSTGDITKQAKTLSKDWMAAASAIQSVGAAMQSIENPALKVMGTIAQAIASIALGAGQAIEAKSRETGNKWEWIAFAASATATMLSSITAVKQATSGRYAEGGIIPGNNHNDGLIAYVSSGELILNRAQQNSIASQLQGNNSGSEMQPYLDVERIWLGLKHYTNRTGKGEIVTSR